MEISLTDLLDICGDAGIYDENIRDDYSGRAMYGRECFGIVGNESDLVTFIKGVAVAAYQAGQENDDDNPVIELADELENVRSDSMGMDAIYYWPSVQVTE
jgi:hypothetical protein